MTRVLCLRRAALIVTSIIAVAILCGCSSSSPSPQSIAKETKAVADALASVGTGTLNLLQNPYTQTFTSPAGGTIVLALATYPWVVNTTDGTYGTLTFTGYVDPSSGETLNGTLQVQVYQTGGSLPDVANGGKDIVWSGFVGYVDVTGTLQLTGPTSGSLVCDFLATFNGGAPTLSGTFSMGSTFFDAGTGIETKARERLSSIRVPSRRAASNMSISRMRSTTDEPAGCL